MGLRFYRRKALGNGFSLGLSKSGLNLGKRGRRGSVSVGPKGPGVSIRLARGLSYIFRK